MQTVFGILAIVAGVILPMAMVGWLALRMGRTPRPPARQVGLVLAFNGVLPLGLILWGLGMLSPEFWASSLVRMGTYATLIAAAVILVLLLASPRVSAPAEGRDG